MEETDYSIMQENTQKQSRSLAGELTSYQDPKDFEKLFRQHYGALCRHSLRFVKQEEIAEEIVQETFISLWEKEGLLKIHSSLIAYLYTAVRNRSLNYLKSPAASRQKAERDSSPGEDLLTDNTQESLDYEELSQLLAAGIESLPGQCRVIFEMSRHGGFSNQEIAQQLNLSPKTIENQIGIALKKLKQHLRLHWELLLVLLMTIS